MLHPPILGEITQGRVRGHHHVAAAPAVTAVWSPFGDELLAAEAQPAVTAATRFCVDLDSVVKHGPATEPRALVGRSRDGDVALVARLAELDHAFAEREDRVVAAEPGAWARAEPGPALPNDDHPRLDALAREDLHAKSLRLGVAA